MPGLVWARGLDPDSVAGLLPVLEPNSVLDVALEPEAVPAAAASG